MSYNIPAPGARFRLRSRRLTMLVGAIAIAFAGVAAGSRPARADTEDILRFLAGAAIIAAIVHAVDDRHTPRYIDRWVLPDSCLETVRVHRRTIQVYNARCLDRGGYHNLPNHCERSFRVNGHSRRGYVAECMWDAGYNRESGWHNPRDIRPVPPRYDHNSRLPERCEMTYRQSGHRVNGYWGHCLSDAGFRDLPRDCRLRTRDGDHVYNRQCLQNAGYRRAH